MPLSPSQIKRQIWGRGDSVLDLAQRWGVGRFKLSRVINRTEPFVYPHIRKKLARYLKVPISEVGREPQKVPVKKAA